MPSPFPGMDPYLESPEVWPDLHDRLATLMSAQLNESLPRSYYAQLEMRPEIGIVNRPASRRVVPDVSVVRTPRHHPQVDGTSGVAVLERVSVQPRHDLSPAVVLSISTERFRHKVVEVRDSSRGHELVTLIEIVSPSNKRSGPDRDAYVTKQREVLASDASLVQIDLIRAGERPFGDDVLGSIYTEIPDRADDYMVLVDRAAGRAQASIGRLEAFPASLREMLPCFPVPLRSGDKDVPLDLQYAFNRAYDTGPYARGAVDYDAPLPPPALAADDAAWVDGLLRTAGIRS